MWIVPPILISTYRCLYLYGHLCILHFCVLHCLKAKCCHYINYFVQNITILSSSKCAIVQIRNDSKIKFIVYCFIFVEIYLTSIMWMENRGGPRLFVISYMLTPICKIVLLFHQTHCSKFKASRELNYVYKSIMHLLLEIEASMKISFQEKSYFTMFINW